MSKITPENIANSIIGKIKSKSTPDVKLKENKPLKSHTERKIIYGVLHKNCSKCNAMLPVDSDHFYREKKCSDGYVNTCKKCQLKRNKKWADANKQKCRQKSSKYRATNAEAEAERRKKRTAERDKRLSQAIPPWSSFSEVEDFYEKARRMRAYGVDAVVDHLIPLAGKLVCGLNCPENMRITKKKTNASKGNYHESEEILKKMDVDYCDIGKTRRGNYIDQEAVKKFLMEN